ncbi:hypothetical protein IAU59_005836 [Kwoniella sp. CBS 9459]
MPSIFNRNRRASEALPSAFAHAEDSPGRNNKRLSVDISRADINASSPPTSGGKIKSFFGVGSSPDPEARRGSLRQKLSSPSTFFKSQVDVSNTSPTRPSKTAAPPSDGVIGRYADPAPRANGSPEANGGRFASPTLFPENFTLASTSSPEGQPRTNGDGRRSSISWQPSYPLVLPDDDYAHITPDGHALSNGHPSPPSANNNVVLPNENAKRRSMDINDHLAGWPAMQPTSNPSPALQPPVNIQTVPLKPPADSLASATIPVTPPKQISGLPTPPLSPPAEHKATETLKPPEASGAGRRRPSLSIDISDVAIPGSTAAIAAQKQEAERAETKAKGQFDGRPMSMAGPSRVPLNDTLPTPSSISQPSSPLNSARPRPNPPLRKSTLIQSPPMPQPIKNLPTLQGWPGFSSPTGGSTTPGWGALAKEGGPKTPGGLMGTPSGQRTPGLAGFPFSLPPVSTPSGKGKEKGILTAEELRKAKRHMPVMLRQPSTQPTHDDEGGDAGDDDEESDGESETEVEGGRSDDDSDGETETEPKASGSKGPMGLAGRLARKNKGKGKGSSNQVSPMAKTAVREEEANGKSVWSLQTPSEKRPQTSWAEFGSGTPTGTPASKAPFGSTPRREVVPATPNRASLIRNESSYASTATASTASSGYFDSQPASSGVSTGATSTPRSAEPALPKHSAANEAPGTHDAAGFELGGAVVPSRMNGIPTQADEDDNAVEDGSDSDSDVGTNEGSAESPNISTHSHEPQIAAPQPTRLGGMSVPHSPVQSRTSGRPGLYSQVSRSMVNLPSKPPSPVQAEADSGFTDRLSTKPKLETVPSGEQVPTRIAIPPPIPEFKAVNTVSTPVAEWAKPPPTPAAGLSSFNFWAGGKDKPALKRRRSMDDSTKAPPKYEPPFPGVFIPRPRDEEGREKLPEYWCAVHIEGQLQRKMEFISQGVQARDRSWKKQYFIIHGTSLYVYKFDPHRFPLKNDAPIPTVCEEEAEENLHVHCPMSTERRGSVSSQMGSTTGTRRGSISAVVDATRRGSAPDINNIGARRGSNSGSPPFISGPGTGPGGLRRASESSGSGARRSSLSIVTNASSLNVSSGPDVKDPALFPGSAAGSSTSSAARRGSTSTPSVASSTSSTNTGTSLASHFQHNALVKQYSLQGAESGLAADYHKKKNVVRVRVKGEQFLIQTGDAREVVNWIEAFQAATNVSLDLDERPMPKIITLPRRRRRRAQPGARTGAAATATAVNGDAAAGTSDTPAGNIAAVSAADAASRERERMLAEDQQAEVGP